MKSRTNMLVRCSTRGLASLSARVQPKYIEIPGVRQYIIPHELMCLVGPYRDGRKWHELPSELPAGLKSWQRKALQPPRQYDGSTLLTYETGLGKSAVAALLVRGRTLIVCSANHRYTWADEFARWCDGDVPVFRVIEKSTDWDRLLDEESAICTPTMLGRLPDSVRFSSIIFDESHALKNSKTAAWQAAHKLVMRCPKSIRVGLSATPAANEPKDLWAQLELLWPRRFGTEWKFLKRYTNEEVTEYGTSFSGVREEHAAELKARLDCVTFRATKMDAVLAGDIPPLDMRAVYVRKSEDKTQRLIDWLTSCEEQHVGLFFYHPASAEKLRAALGGSRPFLDTDRQVSPVLHGGIVAKRRMRELEKIKTGPKTLTLCTIEAMGESIDLTFMERVGLCEYTYKPSKIVQFLGRFQRLSSTHPVRVDAFAQVGTQDELRVSAVAEKLEAINRCIQQGASEAAVAEILKVNEDAIFEEAKNRMGLSDDDGEML